MHVDMANQRNVTPLTKNTQTIVKTANLKL